jgi:arabinofuranosyltransferase
VARLRAFAGLAALVGLTAWLSYVMRDNRIDDAFVTYRHAQQLAAGRGFVFNTGERVLATTAPLHALLLGAAGLFTSAIPAAALVVGFASAVALGLVAYHLLARHGKPLAGAVAAALITTCPTTYSFAPLETILAAALCWGTLLAAAVRNTPLFCALGVLAIVCRADAAFAVVAALSGAVVRDRETRWALRAGAITLACCLPWYVFSWLYFASLTPNTAYAKSGWPGHAWVFGGFLWARGLSPLTASPLSSAVVLAAAAVGLWHVVRERSLRLLLAVPIWALLLVIAYTGLRIFWPHHWYYYPLQTCAAVYAGLGAEAVVQRLSKLELPTFERFGLGAGRLAPLSLAALLLVVIAGNARALHTRAEWIPYDLHAGGRDWLYRDVASWLRSNTEKTSRVASLEVGTLAYYSDRSMIDRMGLATPDAAREMKRTRSREVSVEWTLAHARPDYFVEMAPLGTPLHPPAGFHTVHVSESRNCGTQLAVFGRAYR